MAAGVHSAEVAEVYAGHSATAKVLGCLDFAGVAFKLSWTFLDSSTVLLPLLDQMFEMLLASCLFWNVSQLEL